MADRLVLGHIIEDFLPLAILVPTLDRPHRVMTVMENIHEVTPKPHRILWCASDEESIRLLRVAGEWVLDDSSETDRRYVTRMNKLVPHVGDARTIFFGSDDVKFRPYWFESAISVMSRMGVSVVVPNDLHNPNGTAALMKTSYLERAVFDAPGLAFHPGYIHNFADNEQFYTAMLQKDFAYAVDSVVEHLHPVFGGPGNIGWDDTYKNASVGWGHDETLFYKRKAMLEAKSW